MEGAHSAPAALCSKSSNEISS